MRNLKSCGIKGVPFATTVDKALQAKQAENDILDEEKIIWQRKARETQRNFKPGYQGSKGRQIQVQHP